MPPRASGSLTLSACPANPHLPFDKLRVNGMGIEDIDVFPFVLSLSKHEQGFAGQALNWLSFAAVSTRSIVLGCAKLAILDDAWDHEFSIQPA